MGNLKYDTNESIYKREIGSQIWRTDLWLPRERGHGETWIGSFELAVANFVLIYIEWKNNKLLLYSIGTIFIIL